MRRATQTEQEDPAGNRDERRDTERAGKVRIFAYESARHVRDATATVDRIKKRDYRRYEHQQTLEEIGVDTGQDAAADNIEPKHRHTDDGAGRRGDIEDRCHDDAHGQHLGAQIAEHTQDDDHGHRAACGLALVAELGDVAHGVDLAHVADAHHAFAEHEPGEREAERCRNHDAGDKSISTGCHGRGAADDSESALDRGEHGDSHHQYAQASAGDIEVSACLCPCGGPGPDHQDDGHVGADDEDNRGVHAAPWSELSEIGA